MLFSFLFLLGVGIILFVPSLIVIFWKKRPVLAYILGSVIAFLTVIAPELIKTYQAMVIYGTGDPQLMAGGLSAALARGLFLTPIILPLLALIQWVFRRRYKRKIAAQPSAETFD